MKTIEVEIVRMLGRLNALSRRTPTSPQEVPEAPRGHGRGRMLGLLHDHGEMSQSQIASLLDIRPQSLSEMLTKAESDGVIVRRQSTEDKRQTLVSLTELGQSRVETGRGISRSAYRRRKNRACRNPAQTHRRKKRKRITKTISSTGRIYYGTWKTRKIRRIRQKRRSVHGPS